MIGVFVFFSFLLLLSTTNATECVNHFPWKLDIGFYWATLINSGQNVSWSKSCPDLNVTSANFDSSKPTLLMTHGLQPDMVMQELQFALDGELDDVLKVWIMRGYNVGVFIWTAFADEKITNFVHTEDQIYTTAGFVKMRYRVKKIVTKRGGRVHGPRNESFIKILEAPQDKSVSDYYIEQWKFHFKNGVTYLEIHVLGHSLGTQLTLFSAYRIHKDDTIDNKPSRITLLDAVMSPAKKMHFQNSECGKTVTHNMGCMSKYLNYEYNVSIEYYKSSFINRCIFSSREYSDLIKYTAFATVQFHEFGMHPLGSCWDERLLQHVSKLKDYIEDISYQMNYQHIYIVPYYLMTFFMPPHRCVLSTNMTVCTQIDQVSLSAAMSTAEVLTWSRPIGSDDYEDKLCFQQFDQCEIAGFPLHNASTMTLTSSDDLFFLKKCSHINT